MPMIANGQTGLKRTLGSATFICLLIAFICYQSTGQFEGTQITWAGAASACGAWQFGIRLILGSTTGNFENPTPTMRILAAILGFGGLLALLLFPNALLICIIIAAIAAIIDIVLAFIRR